MVLRFVLESGKDLNNKLQDPFVDVLHNLGENTCNILNRKKNAEFRNWDKYKNNFNNFPLG